MSKDSSPLRSAKKRVRKKKPKLLPLIIVNTQVHQLVIHSKDGKRSSTSFKAVPWATPCELGGVWFMKRRLTEYPVIEFRKGLNITVNGEVFHGYQVPIFV
jgi:hypothetical protein